MAKVLKELKGHSKSKVSLVEDDGKIFVRKSGDISRNMERYSALASTPLRMPRILEYRVESYDMEYIPNLDIKSYLSKNSVGGLVEYIKCVMNMFANQTIEADFTPIYKKKLAEFDFTKYSLPFTADELIAKLPQFLPFSEYHGDFTLENILYDTQDGQFVLIDPISTEYSSYAFDLAKLRQDLTCKWFIRNDNVYFDSKLEKISNELKSFKNFDNDYLLILMLMRVLPYATKVDQDYLMSEIYKLWK
jgi:tRNA A-37 threonylcarbamoyl transferase component Bud32